MGCVPSSFDEVDGKNRPLRNANILNNTILAILTQKNLLPAPPAARLLCQTCISIEVNDFSEGSTTEHLKDAWNLPQSATECPICYLFLDDVLSGQTASFSQQQRINAYSNALGSKGLWGRDEATLILRFSGGVLTLLTFSHDEEDIYSNQHERFKSFHQ